jgi:hypothetical protein
MTEYLASTRSSTPLCTTRVKQATKLFGIGERTLVRWEFEGIPRPAYPLSRTSSVQIGPRLSLCP